MIFTVIHIGTGYLNRPNWLLAGYSVYHRVASRLPSRVPAHNVYDRPAIPAIWHQRRRARDATDFYECMMIHSRIESPSVLMHIKVLVRYIIGTGCIFCRIRESVRTNIGYAYESFSKVYWDRVYIFFARRVVCDRVRFSTPSGTPRPNESRVHPTPPPPPGTYV